MQAGILARARFWTLLGEIGAFFVTFDRFIPSSVTFTPLLRTFGLPGPDSRLPRLPEERSRARFLTRVAKGDKSAVLRKSGVFGRFVTLEGFQASQARFQASRGGFLVSQTRFQASQGVLLPDSRLPRVSQRCSFARFQVSEGVSEVSLARFQASQAPVRCEARDEGGDQAAARVPY